MLNTPSFTNMLIGGLSQELSKMAVKSLLNGVEDKNDYYKFDEEIMSSGNFICFVCCYLLTFFFVSFDIVCSGHDMTK